MGVLGEGFCNYSRNRSLSYSRCLIEVLSVSRGIGFYGGLVCVGYIRFYGEFGFFLCRFIGLGFFRI